MPSNSAATSVSARGPSSAAGGAAVDRPKCSAPHGRHSMPSKANSSALVTAQSKSLSSSTQSKLRNFLTGRRHQSALRFGETTKGKGVALIQELEGDPDFCEKVQDDQIVRLSADADDEFDMRKRLFSSPSELKPRRTRHSVRRERYYGSVENVDTIGGSVRNAHRFRLEPGTADVMGGAATELSLSKTPVMVENPTSETRWYWKYFLGKVHQNYAGIDPQSKRPFFISVMVEEESTPDNIICRAIMWLQTGPRRLCVPYSRPVPVKSIIQKFPGLSDYNRSLKEIANVKIQKDLIVLEDQEGGINCKFGVIFAKSGQTSDFEMMGNEHGNEEFEQFLSVLGQRIQLNGWGNYKGGLDTTTNSTGRESVYTTFSQYEIMFHVSTMLPHSKDNIQQVERKRHIGNDIVNIVFEVGEDPTNPTFSPTYMKSHFTHIFAVVTFDKRAGVYRLWVYSEKSVPVYGPPLPCPNEFADPRSFREFLLTKIINGEKAALQAQAFVDKRLKTNDSLINDMYLEYLKDCPKGFTQKLSEQMVKLTKTTPKKEDQLFEFVKYGELIKLEKSLSGDVAYYAPKKLSLCRKQPWEPQLLFTGAPFFDEILSSDSWGQLSVLLLNREHELLCIDADATVPATEAIVDVQQMSALEEFGLFLARFDTGKEASMCVFPLSDLKAAIRKQTVITRKECCSYRLPDTRGCHLYSTTDPFGLRLSVVVCIGKRLVLLRWAFGPLGPIQEGTDVTKNFSFIAMRILRLFQELLFTEEPTTISAYDMGFQGSVRAAFVAKSGLHVADFSSGTVRLVETPILPKSKFRDLIAIADGSAEEILYTFDNVTVTILSDDQNVNETQELFWTSNINAVVYRFPFLIGFAHDMVEVRLAINGNLLSSVYMPTVKLLSSKQDIVFSSEKPPNSSSVQDQDSNPQNLTPVTTSLRFPTSKSSRDKYPALKRCDLYCIPAKNLLSEDQQAGAVGGISTNRSPLRPRPNPKKDSRAYLLDGIPYHPGTGAGNSNFQASDSFDDARSSEVSTTQFGTVSTAKPEDVLLKTALQNNLSSGSDSGVGTSAPQSFEHSSVPNSPLKKPDIIVLEQGDIVL